jgi:FdhE protein
MGNSNDRFTMQKEDMDRLKAEKPHVAPLIDAFGPLRLTEHAFQEKIADKAFTLSPDKLKVMGGVPLIKDHPLFFLDDPWQDLAIAVAAAIQEGFPHLAEEMNRLSTYLRQNSEKLNDYFLRFGSFDENKISTWAAEIQIEPAALSLLINTVQRIVLTGRARTMIEEIADITWDKGYCPLCGSFPMLAFLRVNGQRWLHCACCHHEWTYPRLKCPHCEHETPDDTTYLYVEEDKENSAFICVRCRRYLVTVNRAECLREMDPDLTAIGLAHLDVVLQGKGYFPMAEREWNAFDQ